jgi:hypothetical protein
MSASITPVVVMPTLADYCKAHKAEYVTAKRDKDKAEAAYVLVLAGFMRAIEAERTAYGTGSANTARFFSDAALTLQKAGIEGVAESTIRRGLSAASALDRFGEDLATLVPSVDGIARFASLSDEEAQAVKADLAESGETASDLDVKDAVSLVRPDTRTEAEKAEAEDRAVDKAAKAIEDDVLRVITRGTSGNPDAIRALATACAFGCTLAGRERLAKAVQVIGKAAAEKAKAKQDEAKAKAEAK